MPVSTQHPEYKAARPNIELVEDAVSGNVKQEKYVPRLSGQSTKSWEAYVGRAAYYNVTERSLLALVGALLRKPYTIEGVVNDEPHVDDTTFGEFMQRAYRTLLCQGRIGLHVDYDEVVGSPKLIAYPSENIINWSDDFVVIEECVHVRDPDDPYVLKSVPQWRELYLEDGVYSVRLWRQEGRQQFKVVEQYTPTQRGKALTALPFWFVTPYDNSDTVYTAPLTGLSELNVMHLRFSVDLGHGLHYTALPQAYISGRLNDEPSRPGEAAPVTQLAIGTDQVWMLAEGSTAAYLEFSGAGLSAIRDHVGRLEEQMYAAGSRLLTSKRGVESAEALHLRAGSESAVLTTMALALEHGLTRALNAYNQWAGSTTEVTVALNKDFTASVIDAGELKVLLEAYAAGAISLDTFLQRLYDGELVADVNAEKLAIGERSASKIGEDQ